MNYIAYLLGIDLPGKDGNGKAPHKPGWWAYLSTMKFAIVILIVLGALSLAAMFVNELADPNAMAKQPTSALGAAGRLLFMIFQMEDPFRSWWYRGLMGVLTLSLFACVLERTPIVWRLWKRAASPDTSWVDNAPTAIVRSVKAPRENVERRLAHTWRWRLKQSDVWVGEHGRLAMWGPLLTHYGMLFIVVGALVTSFGGLSTRAGGYSGEVVKLEDMPFEVRIDSFRVQYYPLQPGQWVLVDNQWIGKLAEMNADSTWIVLQYRTETDYDRVSMEPQYITNHWDNNRDRSNIKRFVSWVTIFEDGKDVGQQEVAVNSPLRRDGYRFYQSSYDPDNPRFTANYAAVMISASDSASGTSHTLTLKPGESVQVPGDTLTVAAGKLLPHFKLGADHRAYSQSAEFANPAVELTFRGPNGSEKSQWIFVKFPSHEAGPGKYTYKVADLDGESAGMEMATIFEIKKTHGTGLLWLGFLFGTVGLVLSFYFNHRVLYVEWPTDLRNHIRMIGLTRKTHHLYERDIDRLLEGVSGRDREESVTKLEQRPATLNK